MRVGSFAGYVFTFHLNSPVLQPLVTKCVRPLRGRLLLTHTAAGYVPLALHPRLWTFAAFGDGKREREGTSVLHKYSFYCINIQNGSVFWYAAFYSLKALVSRCKTKGFRVRNQGFQDVKPRVLQTRGINFEKCKQCHCICLQIITIFTFVKLKSALPPFCIFMQFWGCEDVKTMIVLVILFLCCLVAGGRGTEATVLLKFAFVGFC